MTTEEKQTTEEEPTENKGEGNKPFLNLKSDGLNIASCIQIAIAFILVLNLFVLYRNLGSLNRQIELTGVLNQPLCAVKEVKVNEVKYYNLIKISAVLANSGNYIAKNASIEWQLYQRENLLGANPTSQKIKGRGSSPSRKSNIAILPKQEFDYFLIYIAKEDFDKRVQGYDRGVEVRLTIKYTDMDNKPQQYESSFLIIRLGPQNFYEVTIQQSSIKEQQEEVNGLQKQDLDITQSQSRNASPNVQLDGTNKASK